jgi:NADPH-dependent curcumin reductase
VSGCSGPETRSRTGSSAADWSRAAAASPASPVQRASSCRLVRVSGCSGPETRSRTVSSAAYWSRAAAASPASPVGRVTASEHPGFAVGEHVYGGFGVQEFACSDGTGVTRLDPLLAPLPAYLGALGIPGLTAYFGLLQVARLREGETVVISGAAGGVGSVAGQIAKISRCRAIGIAGGPDKCRWIVSDLRFDAAIDYKVQDVAAALREYAPGGVDVFFDNVGGEILDAVLARLARGARIVLSGGLSQYAAQQVRGPSNYLELIAARASMAGFLTPDYAGRYAQARAELAGWLREGRLISREDILQGGVRAFPDALPKLFAGQNIGKLILAVR